MVVVCEANAGQSYNCTSSPDVRRDRAVCRNPASRGCLLPGCPARWGCPSMACSKATAFLRVPACSASSGSCTDIRWVRKLLPELLPTILNADCAGRHFASTFTRLSLGRCLHRQAEQAQGLHNSHSCGCPEGKGEWLCECYLQMLQSAGGLVFLQRLLNLLLQHWGERRVPSIPQQVVGLLKVSTPRSHLHTPLALLHARSTASSTMGAPILPAESSLAQQSHVSDQTQYSAACLRDNQETVWGC